MSPLYDRIGQGYAARRRPDPTIARAIHIALGDAQTVLNVGAGTGSYEPTEREVVALEPSAEMIRQRPPDAGRAVQGVAENLPFADGEFDAAMAVLTLHHWSDVAAGLSEMQRVTRQRLVFLTFDPAGPWFWLAEYFPELVTLDQDKMPTLGAIERVLGPVTIAPVPVPDDCVDGFLGAFWRRPQAYLDPQVRAGMSSFSRIRDLASGLARLEQDLVSGAWEDRYGHLLGLKRLDIGYRLLVAELG